MMIKHTILFALIGIFSTSLFFYHSSSEVRSPYPSLSYSTILDSLPPIDSLTAIHDTIVIRDTIIVDKTPELDYKVPIHSSSVGILYFQCGNTINLDLPEGISDPTLKATQAQVIPSKSKPSKYTIVPSGKTCQIQGRATKPDGSTLLWEKTYRVVKPPKPSIQLLVNGKEYNGVAPFSKKSNCVVRIRPDSDFQAGLPKDARYIISRVDLMAQRSLGAPSKIGTYSGSGKDAGKGISIPLGSKLKSDPPGTKIYFKIDKVYRVNFQNKKVQVKFSDRDLYVGGIVK